VRANRFRRREPGRIVNGRNIGQPHNGANARRRHQKPHPVIAPLQLVHLFLKAVQLSEQDLMHGKKRLCDRLQRRGMLRKLYNPAGEACLRGPAHLEAEASQNASEAHLDIVKLSLHQLACGQNRARLLPGADLQCTGRNQPSRSSWAMPRASFRSVFTGIALKASRTCRVSNNSTANPAFLRPA